MNNHIPKEYYEACKDCIKKCEQVIVESKELLSACKLVNIPAKCMQEINDVLIVADECITQCEKAMDRAKQHKENCDDDQCKHICDDIIFAGRECIKACDGIEIECQEDLKPCIYATEDTIKKAEECIKACKEIVQD